ncbi:Domain of unknown function DUF1904 [Ferrimonas balearica DSM 9799]|uniref:DUF1904 domain-containing protein n=1 Tax=Ferrimonas balearica (strain DSM 9799 / CCM 4581 / KCTC 23876 / PAT) TaxID=550540 RepID=E1ST83_FERBD|nr:DUF1904 family protein [Ferrimonas balearica]MBY6016616.1 DUF1904 domain-containing protein [Halomonas denitrificans]ADN76130.1 Domain of unknown function DUF1904 [Ferrimonas balearica DSM 9799]MBW3139040.1 DUF1904 domain-containing protein [Ferrimonas balearica]MBW3163368.1 DUF1904 domain-containing protein [Ferrimonas balearica]MBY5981064.1 DUF1904 domain-containing protein [Ferrimonas balearica]
MPHLRVRGLANEQVQALSEQLTDPLSQLFGCPDDHITIEAIASTFFFRGAPGGGYPMVELLWFDRGLDVQDQVARLITDTIRTLCQAPELDVAVIVSPLSQRHYYENGEHF